ncbi:MAG: VIT domain-containing protein [Anaerolineales bacterium]
MLPHTRLRNKLMVSFGFVLFLLAFVYHPALADGIVIPDPPPWPDPVPLEDTWLTIRYHRVSVEINNQVAVTRVEQEFVNEHDWEAEGTYIFPIPENSSISKFVMWVDGVPIEGNILPAEQARKIYEDIVRERRDPALLEYIGRDAVQARIFPIPPGGARKIELEYSQVLSADNGLVRYSYPLNTEKFSAQPLEDCSVNIVLESDQPLQSVYSPTYQDRIYIQRDGNYRVTVGYEEGYVLPDQDFDLIYTFSQEEIGLQLMTYPDPRGTGGLGQEGYFLLMAAPTVTADRVVPRDVVLVLDTSGSMDGEKLKQAKEASKYVMNHLNEEDRFNIIAFSTGISHFGLGLQGVSKVPEAVAWIDRMEALGGTNINLALLEALSIRSDQGESESGRPLVLLFLTDGLPTEGITEIDQIIANVRATTTSSVRLFAFGVGDDVNTLLLDTLAGDNRGLSSYVRPQERIDEEVSALFAKIKTPVLTDLVLDFGGILVEEIYPPVLPDLFSGTQLLITGRYRLPVGSSGKTKIELSGSVNAERKAYIYETDFSPREEFGNSASTIPRLWATRKIGYLLSQIRLMGENKEWVDAIIQLSVQYGIITPYTSFLIEEHDIFSGEGLDEAARDLVEEYSGPAVGAEAVNKADAESSMRSAESYYQPEITGGDFSQEGNQPIVKYIEDKTFLRQNGIWIDTAYEDDSRDTVKIGFGSEVYFDLLNNRPSWGKYLALGECLIFLDGDTVYEIVEGEGELKSLPSQLSQPEEEAQIKKLEEPRELPGSNSFCTAPLILGLAVLGFGIRRER